MRKLLLTFVLLGSFALIASAQSKTITGVVIDVSDGSPIMGATVVEKGTTNGVITNEDGKYSITLRSSDATIQFSFIGMKSIEKQATGAKLNIKMTPDVIMVGTVEVTAMGMTKDKKALGYASTVVKADELNSVQSGSMMSGLTGKVAGLNISTAGGTGTSQKVVVRGFSSFTNNQPLYVVDGTPIQNNLSAGTGNNSFSDAVDVGNGAGDINPDDIESVTVLKGASATALYGSRASNGVIMITTKKAGKDQKPLITYSGALTANEVLRVPQTQNKFGQGWNNGYWLNGGDQGENGSWGPRLDGRNHIWGAPVDGVYREKPYSYVKDNLRNFYETGLDRNNNISLSTSGKHTGIYLSYGNLTSDGVIPSNADKYVRNTFSFSGNTNYDKLTISYNVNFSKKDVNAVTAGQGNNGATLSQEIIQHPVDINFQDLKDLSNPYNSIDNYYTFYAQNPYWVIANNGNNYKDNHTYGNIAGSYEFLKGIKFRAKAGGDFTDSRLRRWNAVAKLTPDSYNYNGGKKDEPGSYQEHNESSGQIDLTGMIDVNKNINKDINISGFAGMNYNQIERYFTESLTYGLATPGWYSLENGTDKPTSFSRNYTRRLIGALAQTSLGYKDFWYTTFSIRNDWSSTLPENNRSFLYWGANTSLILTQMYPDMQNEYLSFLKLRLAYGKTGNDANWYLTNNSYVPTNISLGFGDINLPVNQVPGITISNVRGNNNLKPEITTEAEFGVESRFLSNRVSVDFSYYDRNTKDQIIAAVLPNETGYSQYTRNVGEIQNRGVELALGITPVRTKDWEWTTNITFSKNKSVVNKLWDIDGVQQKEYVLSSAYDVDFVAEVGKPLGVFKVPKKLTTEDGKVIVSTLGFPQFSADEKEDIGTSSPDFVMGFSNRVKWKNLSMGMVFDWRNGGSFYSNTARMLSWNGDATGTTFNDRQPFIVPNSVKVVGGQYVENDIPISNNFINYYYGTTYNKEAYENSVISKSYLKMRELSITYDLPKTILANTFVKGVQFALIGRNLFLWTPKENNFVDPEATNYGNDISSEFGEFSANPTMRSYGGSIKATF